MKSNPEKFIHSSTPSVKKIKIPVKDLAVFAVLGTIMYISRVVMAGIPSVHILGLIIASVTIAYRVRALIPIYVYVMLEGIFAGFSLWWLPYTYMWLILWAMFMLAGKLKIPNVIKIPLYMVVCGLHGMSFGILWAPAQALMFNFSFEMTVACVMAGFWFDLVHGISNFAAGSLILPLSELLKILDKRRMTA